jgi:hypothetical protein
LATQWLTGVQIAEFMHVVANNAADMCEANQHAGDPISLARAAQDVFYALE